MQSMNILLLTADADRVGVALCVAQRETHCALEGEVTTSGESTLAVLREPRGPELHRAELPGTFLADGLSALLAWLTTRNIRVDLVTHRIAQHGTDETFLRLSPAQLGIMEGFTACKDALPCVQAVSAWNQVTPQFVHFSVRPHTPESLVSVIAGSGARPPAGCPKKMKVRCETCSAS
ncbi:hypothetical protein WJ93_08155 [Burkholderia ubonensis]|nr:hypothetical protein WJ93_08155 [Burkholderia ubonensis]